jgi:predicted Zn finger-like uncharacterized protein
MYTQCPQCKTAFRLTAEVLKQAGGKVRCGSCGDAFNALDFLSEEKPGVAPSVEESLPELTPDPAELEETTLPRSISAEQSAALLKTLDELAGSDVRIEDTGVEWRVVDAEEAEASEAVASEEENGTDDTGSVRWFIDDSPTPVDEQLSAEPGIIDSQEIFQDATVREQMRFDDDTPLPEDFDFNVAPSSEPTAIIEARDDTVETESEQVDLALGDPEDWEDLLEEVDEPAVAPLDVETIADVDNVVVATDTFEANGEEASPSELVDIKPIPDVDEQFATQAEAMGIDLSGMHARLRETAEEPGDEAEATEEETSLDDDLVAAALETEAAANAGQKKTDADEESFDETVVAELSNEAESVAKVSSDAEVEPTPQDIDAAGEDQLEFDVDFDDSNVVEARDRELLSSTEEDAKLAAELGLDDSATDTGPEKPEPVFLPESEEEKTVNMLIDQELLAVAVEDQDGFTSTIVQEQLEDSDVVEQDIAEEPTEAAKEDPLVETIIMEGEFIRDADEEERLEKVRRETGDPNLKSAAAADVKELPKNNEEQAVQQPLNYRMVAGIALLAIVLAVQGMHQMRRSLVTLPVVGAHVGSLYRAIGRPVTPDWDVSGWRFEATKGSTDESDAVLTIYSRVGNKSAEPLPYPLISVSLTDRYEDIIGSKVLEPGDYLAESLDTRQPVAPGDTFSAVISIESPSAEATGFKLNVCYRQIGGKLKCAIEDFK